MFGERHHYKLVRLSGLNPPFVAQKFVVELTGFEPIIAEPKSAVLPLHHSSPKPEQIYLLIFQSYSGVRMVATVPSRAR